ncbi:MAG: hemerythrin domain-containing protein [Bacteroidota bacterium]
MRPAHSPGVDPIARFLSEHERVLHHLTILSRNCRQMQERGYSAAAHGRALEAISFLEEEVTVHNRGEEEALFPVLERYVEGPTGVMRREHRDLARVLRRLKAAASRLRGSPGSRSAAAHLCETALSVSQCFVNHIHKENHILFPLVRKFLTKEALREIARRML